MEDSTPHSVNLLTPTLPHSFPLSFIALHPIQLRPMELPSAFQTFAELGPSSAAPSCSRSPQRTYGFLEKALEDSPVSVLQGSRSPSVSSSNGSAHLADRCQIGEVLSRQGSLASALRQQQAAEQQRADMLATGPRLSIKAGRGQPAGSRGLRLRPARSAQLPAAAGAGPVSAAAELQPCDATLPSTSGLALAARALLARRRSSNLDIPSRWGVPACRSRGPNRIRMRRSRLPPPPTTSPTEFLPCCARCAGCRRPPPAQWSWTTS